jgi:hypothetical protein
MLTINGKGRWRWVAAGGLASASLLVGTTGATASTSVPRTLPKNLAQFAHCPVNVKSVTVCLFSAMATTQFTIGSTTVSTTAPTKVSLGLIVNSNGSIQTVAPTDGSATMSAPEIPLPGGLLGLPAPLPNVLPVNTKAQLVGLPGLNLTDLLAQKGVAFDLPIDVGITDSLGLLGSNCTIGATTSQILLRLTTGKTAPPAPNQPITGARGKLTGLPDGELLDAGIRLVDNSFAVPGAANCGPSLLSSVVDSVIDTKQGLPSAAGKNTAILTGNSYTIPASVIRKYIG